MIVCLPNIQFKPLLVYSLLLIVFFEYILKKGKPDFQNGATSTS